MPTGSLQANGMDGAGARGAIDWSSGRERISITTPSRAALLTDIDRHFIVGEGFTIATLNLDHVVKLRRDAAFRAAYARHSHVVADGNPIVWLSRLAGQKIDLVPGSELIDPIAEIAARHSVPVALFGSTRAALDESASALRHHFPGLQIAVRISPPMGFDPTGPEADEAIGDIDASGARLCFLALGAPKQEIFAVRARDRAPHMGFVSIGAGLDFIAGAQVRAPTWVRALAAEWIWRLLGNPRRLVGRYMACIAVLPSLTFLALRWRLAGDVRSGGAQGDAQ